MPLLVDSFVFKPRKLGVSVVASEEVSFSFHFLIVQVVTYADNHFDNYHL